MVQCLLEHGADVDGCKSNRSSPLIEALLDKHYGIVDILLDWKANVDVKDDEDWRPLHYVSVQGHQRLTRRLMDAGCELEQRDDRGDTPLFSACCNSHRNVVNLFLAHGVSNLTTKCSGGLTYAHIAAYRGLVNLLERILEMSTDLVNQLDWTGLDPLCAAARGGEPAAAELLLAHDASPDGPANTPMCPLSLAAYHGSISIVQMLLRSGAQVDKMGMLLRTPLMWAVREGRARIADHLLKAGANPFLRDELVSAFQTFRITQNPSVPADIVC